MKESQVRPRITKFLQLFVGQHICEVKKHTIHLFARVVQPRLAVYLVLWLSLGHMPQPKCRCDILSACRRHACDMPQLLSCFG